MGLFEFSKVMMVLYNLLILMGGASFIAVGFWTRLTGDVLGSNILGVFSISTVHTIKVDIFFICIGIVMFLLGLLGCCGAKKESKCLLISFFSIISIILISELTIGLLALAYSSHIDRFLISWGRPVLRNQYGRDFHFTSLWNMTMTKMQCCGFNNYTDFTGSYYSKCYGEIFHPSCCRNTTITCDLEYAKNSTVQGCFKWLEQTLFAKLYVLAGVAVVVGGIESGAMLVSLYLFCYLDNRDELKQ